MNFLLNIFNLKLNNSNYFIIKKKKIENKRNDRGQTIYYFFVSRESFNSIYDYNQNTNKLLYVADKAIFKLIKSYFNLYSVNLQNTEKTCYSDRFKRLLINKILINRAELQLISNKIIIIIYIYNSNIKHIIKKLSK